MEEVTHFYGGRIKVWQVVWCLKPSTFPPYLYRYCFSQAKGDKPSRPRIPAFAFAFRPPNFYWRPSCIRRGYILMGAESKYDKRCDVWNPFRNNFSSHIFTDTAFPKLKATNSGAWPPLLSDPQFLLKVIMNWERLHFYGGWLKVWQAVWCLKPISQQLFLPYLCRCHCSQAKGDKPSMDTIAFRLHFRHFYKRFPIELVLVWIVNIEFEYS